MDRQLPYSCYGLLVGGISKQAAFKSIQKDKDIGTWFKRRVRSILVTAANQSSPSWSKQFARESARSNMERLISNIIHWMQTHKRQDKRGRKSWTPQMVATTLGVNMSNWSYSNRWDVTDVYERYLDRCIDQLIKVNHFVNWMSPITQVESIPEVRIPDIPLPIFQPSIFITPLEDPFFGAFNR